MSGPVLRGWIDVDLSRHVDAHGYLSDAGATRAWKILAPCPSGISVRIRLGALRWCGTRLATCLAEAGIANAGRIEVSGENPDGIKSVLAAVNSSIASRYTPVDWEQAWAQQPHSA